MFFLISGAAASGKTTVARRLPVRLQNVACHDADEWRAADAYTRCANLERWVRLALEAQRGGQDFLLTTHSPLGELLACPSAPYLAGIAACLLDCADTVRLERIRARGIDLCWLPNQHTFSWAAWHRLHAYDPQWEQHVIDSNGPSTHCYERWRHWEQHDPRWQVRVFDTTHLNEDQTLDAVAAWVQSARAMPTSTR